MQRADDLAVGCSRHLLDPDTHISAALGEAIAPVVAGIGAKLTNLIAEGISGIGGEDTVDVRGVAGEGVDDVVAYDPHVFERQEQTPRTVPHAWRSVGGVVVVDSVVWN